ncbi:MAG: hypothetical protein KDM64_18420, partial [Verrucomicrobiae bacterium]|nr:hypothetical protein [Verrucomicrobiae bacterium]
MKTNKRTILNYLITFLAGISVSSVWFTARNKGHLHQAGLETSGKGSESFEAHSLTIGERRAPANRNIAITKLPEEPSSGSDETGGFESDAANVDSIWMPLKGISDDHTSLAGIDVGEALRLSHILAKRDPEGLLSVSLALPTGELSMELCRAAFGELSRRNPRTAWKQLEQLSSGRLEETATRTVLESWAEIDPSAAAAALAELARPTADTVSVVAEQWARKDPVAAWQWASQQGE